MNLIYQKMKEEDHLAIHEVMEVWWNGRNLTNMVSRPFTSLFCNTSFTVRNNNELVAFFIGILSQSNPIDAYIHFMGVAPQFRRQGIARKLYESFFDLCRENGRHQIRCCTSSVNKNSIQLHQHLGFEILPGKNRENGVSVTSNYHKIGEAKVLFKKILI